MRLTLAKTALISTSILSVGGAVANDVATLDEQPIEVIEFISDERVEAKQTGNVVETTLPWKDQAGLKVSVDLGEPTIAEKLKDKRNREVVTEPVTFLSEDGQPNGFKVDILLNERPDTNAFCYQIEGAEDYDFFYQPPLTQEEIDEGASRPPEIEGSYAVYHKTLANHLEGQTNYKTGKVMHIPRPQVWSLSDVDTKEWADLSYDERGLCVTVLQDFLDKTEYPVRIDPTFGYTSIGATTVNLAIDGKFFTVYALSGSGSVEKLSVYLQTDNATRNVVGGIYSDTSLVTNGGTNELTSVTVGSSWNDLTYSTMPSLSSGNYGLLLSFDTPASGTFSARSDNLGSVTAAFGAQTYTGSAPAFRGFDGNDNSYSIYATYSAPSTPDKQTSAISFPSGSATTIVGGQVIVP